jgi:hypothetical protein
MSEDKKVDRTAVALWSTVLVVNKKAAVTVDTPELSAAFQLVIAHAEASLKWCCTGKQVSV